MAGTNYLKVLVEDIHSTTVATIGADGHPQTRVIDMMLWDEQGVYFLTAKGEGVLRTADGAAFYCAVCNERKDVDFAAGQGSKYRQ